MFAAWETAALFAKVEAAGLRHEQVSRCCRWEAEVAAKEAERAKKETSGSMLLDATAIGKSDSDEKEWTRRSNTTQ